MPKDEILVKPEMTVEQSLFLPSDKEKEVVSNTFLKFRLTADGRNRNFRYFDGLNLIEYIEDSVHRFSTNIDERENLEDWQARVHDPFTRNKVLAILGKVVSVLPIAQIVGRGDEDVRKGTILTNLYEYAEDVDDYEELMLHVLLEAIVKGTSIAYEGVDKKERMLRDIIGVGDEIKIKEDKEITTKLFGSIVPLEEFYPSSVSIRNIKKMPYCFWRKVIPHSKFIQDWSSYKKSELVTPQRTYGDEEQRPFYLDFISSEVTEGSVEIVRYYDKDKDQYVILANGIWLNPIKGKSGEEMISPLPFNHKELPFWDIKFDFFGDFFYGKSLPDRLKSMQDVLNVLTNMLLDQSFLTIFPPLLTNGYDSIEDDYLRPGRRTPIDTQGIPISQAFMKLDLGTPSGWHQYILEYTRKIMEQSSVDQVTQGIAGVGERTTAREINVAAEGVSSVLGLFGRMVNYGIKRKAYLKSANILQFWTDKDSPIIRRVNGETGVEEFNKVFNVFKLDGAVLTGGKRGTKIIELYADSKDLPTKDEVRARSMVMEAESKNKVEIVAMPGEYIRNFLFDIKLVPNPKSEKSKELAQALQLEKVQVYLGMFPPGTFNVNELAASTAEKMGDDPTRVLGDGILTPQMAGEETMGAGASNRISQMTAGQGRNSGNQQLAQLQNSMIG